ncbi:MAG: tRNA-splicing ligase RtcB [Saprospiraceae bacterium]|jgi:tRNA-splicing ligase RtcB
MQERLTIFGREIIDEQSINQIKNCYSENDYAVLTADAHYGYGHPIGGAVAYKDNISLSGVGFDIGCGNKAVRTGVLAIDVDIAKLMDEIVRSIGFGIGRPNPTPIDSPVFDAINKLDLNIPASQKKALMAKAKAQLGTVGSGNHFVDIFEDAEGYLWIGVHFGSRGFGHTLTTGFIAIAKGKSFGDRVSEGGMDSPPILFDAASETGMDYIEAMNVAGEYAYAGRDYVVDKVMDILQTKANYAVHNHHNFAWKENHFGDDYWVVRKGCTPAFPGQQGFVGANMFDNSVIVEGVDTELSKKALYSTVHGAGRVMSRRKAKGKVKWTKDAKGKRYQKIITPGLVSFNKTQFKAKKLGIELRGAGADESPQCYKQLDEVLYHMGDTIKVLFTLKPIGVAMAGEEVFDPYKD